MTLKHVLTLCAAATLAALQFTYGPRLIGYSCSNPPTLAGFTYHGPRLAREESDFIGTCARIAPIFGE
jgi:hypothetical protein